MYWPKFQKTIGSTEALYLMFEYIFESLGYRRIEWRCDVNNVVCRRSATRLGLQLDGVFKQNLIFKNRNWDVVYYSLLDRDWPLRKMAFEKWLNPNNFDDNGIQLKSLSEIQLDLN